MASQRDFSKVLTLLSYRLLRSFKRHFKNVGAANCSIDEYFLKKVVSGFAEAWA